MNTLLNITFCIPFLVTSKICRLLRIYTNDASDLQRSDEGLACRKEQCPCSASPKNRSWESYTERSSKVHMYQGRSFAGAHLVNLKDSRRKQHKSTLHVMSRENNFKRILSKMLFSTHRPSHAPAVALARSVLPVPVYSQSNLCTRFYWREALLWKRHPH